MNKSLPTIKQQNWGNDLNNYIKELENKVNNINFIKEVKDEKMSYYGSGVVEINDTVGVFQKNPNPDLNPIKIQHGYMIDTTEELIFSGTLYFSNTLSNTSVILDCTYDNESNTDNRLHLKITDNSAINYESTHLYCLYIKLNINREAEFYIKEGDFTSNELLSRTIIPIGYIFMSQLYYTIGNVSLTKTEQFKSYVYPTGNIKYLDFNDGNINVGDTSKNNQITVTGLGYNIISDDNTTCTFSIDNTKPIYILNDENGTYNYNTVNNLSSLNNTVFRIMISNTGTLVVQYGGLETNIVVNDTFVKYYSFNNQPYKALGCVEVARISNYDGPAKNVIFWAAANGISPYLSTNLIPRQSNIINVGGATPDVVFTDDQGSNRYVIVGEGNDTENKNIIKLRLDGSNEKYLLINDYNFNSTPIKLISDSGIELRNGNYNNIILDNTGVKINTDFSFGKKTTVQGVLNIEMPVWEVKATSSQLNNLKTCIDDYDGATLGTCYINYQNKITKVDLKCYKHIYETPNGPEYYYEISFYKNDQRIENMHAFRIIVNYMNEITAYEGLKLYYLQLDNNYIHISNFEEYFIESQNPDSFNLLDLIAGV